MIPSQCIAARELLRLSQEQLADMADLSISTIDDFEQGRPVPDCLVATIQVALEAAGVEFIPESGGRPGVHLMKHR
ncbi:MAG: XRE family transcriptional regulator [Hyphomicrobiales bacterium]|nr:MAG: XRE family transcriptional regulator [Hyphomicrobiales bacterium]